MSFLDNVTDKVRNSYKTLKGNLTTAQRVLIVGSDGKETTVKGGSLAVYQAPDQTKNTVRNTQQVIGTESEALTFPDEVYRFEIFHQTEGTLIHFGDSDVDTTYPTIAANDVLVLEGDDDLNLYVVSDTADTKIFIQYMELV